ncbi:MAG TPA: GntR family transcriptional regulator [Actinomycetota bacterium]
MIQFRLDPRSGVSTYLQLVHQVRNALRLGMLRPGDQLPTVKEVVGSLAINPNTVLKAYRELEHEGLVEGRPGMGTFVLRTLKGPSPDKHAALKRSLDRWLQSAFEAGFDVEAVVALFETTLRAVREEGVA